MMLQVAVFSFLLCSAHSFSVRVFVDGNDESSGNTIEDDELTISARLEKANANLGNNLGDLQVIFGDIAVPSGLQNADPCTAGRCLWPKAADGTVNIPVRISRDYSQRERRIIIQGLRSFENSTCIRFSPVQNEEAFLDIQSREGCFSFIGRRGRGQVVSLSRRGCVYPDIVQHEILHALGFHHEQSRSDRDENVRILFENIRPGLESQFNKVQTRNLGTPYDYKSVMHYDRFAFSRNGQPTILPIPDPNVEIGTARQMSAIDILRVNRLYACNSTSYNHHPKPVQRTAFSEK